MNWIEILQTYFTKWTFKKWEKLLKKIASNWWIVATLLKKHLRVKNKYKWNGLLD
jgi:hypothetical protein